MERGLERAGMECRWQVEIDPFCREVLAKHWPNVKRYRDVREVYWGNVECVDLLCGGFPCQPVSLVGHRRGESDERWLWPEFAKAIAIIQPSYVLIENVPGLLSRGMGTVIGDLAARGYVAEWSVVSACALDFPHTRERLFILAHSDEARWSDHSWRKGQATFASVGQVSDADARRDVWMAEGPRPPVVPRVADGFPGWMDRNGSLGNSVVSQVSEWIGRRIVESLR
jgi:DNA (cytosine-5)-methyltransferase 1